MRDGRQDLTGSRKCSTYGTKRSAGDDNRRIKTGFAVELGEAPFRGKQLFRWIHKGERDFSAMTDFSEKLREKLQAAAFIGGVQVEKTSMIRKTARGNSSMG